MDKVDAATRSRMMSAVKAKNTGPEIAVRSASYALGFRHRLHRGDLPGRPDIVYPRHKLALFVHGCFWHSHPGCPKASIPASNAEFWREKLARNVERDRCAEEALRCAGWRVAVIWECQTKHAATLDHLLAEILGSPRA